MPIYVEYPKASRPGGGALNVIPNCSINIPGAKKIEFLSLPVITDSKGAKYDPSPVIGRSTPILTYGYSETRQISLDLPFIATSHGSESTLGTFEYNQKALWAIATAVYSRKPQSGCPYLPPPVCLLRFGSFLWAENGTLGEGICAILDKYSVKNDPAIPSDPWTLIPYKFTVSTNWTIAYSSESLPGMERVVMEGK